MLVLAWIRFRPNLSWQFRSRSRFRWNFAETMPKPFVAIAVKNLNKDKRYSCEKIHFANRSHKDTQTARQTCRQIDREIELINSNRRVYDVVRLERWKYRGTSGRQDQTTTTQADKNLKESRDVTHSRLTTLYFSFTAACEMMRLTNSLATLCCVCLCNV